MNIDERIEKYGKKRKKRKAWKKIVTGLASVVVFVTVYMLILPAITMESEYYCGHEAHVHDDSCVEQTLICDVHVHDKECYLMESVLICSQDHTHEDACFEEQEILACDKANENHVHDEACYESRRICEKEEHTHTLACSSNPSADIETAYNWEATLPDTLSGFWADDVLAIAKSQLGYKESVENYLVDEAGEMKGYTRYGEWYGYPYGDWCAMFVSFCLDYAGVENFPLEANCQAWINKLMEDELYIQVGQYIPQAGDLIFFDRNGDGRSDHVGIVEEYLITEITDKKDTIKTIEGNSGNCVKRNIYDYDDSMILGYGILPLQQMLLGVEDLSDTSSLINTSGTVMYHAPDYLEYQYSSHRVNDYMTLSYVLIPFDDYMSGNWSPSTIEWSANANANYVVAYCADRNTDVSTAGEQYITYKIEETADYKACAEVLSGIVGHAYPFITAEQMRQELTDAYVAGETAIDLSCCTESEFIAAAQWAVWDITGKSGLQTTASESTFPEYNVDALNPLTNVGHTNAADIQNHVQAIRDWLVTQSAPGDLAVDSHTSSVTENADGTYRIETVVKLDRPLQEKEVLQVSFFAGDHVSKLNVTETGTQEFSVILDDLTVQEVLNAKATLTVSFEHMQVFIYDSGGYQDMISGQWGVDEYELEFLLDVESTEVEVTKHWTGDRVGAESVEVRLYEDGQQYGDPVFLNAENNWSHTWTDLLKYKADGTEIEYTVKEVLVPGYYSSITKTTDGVVKKTSIDSVASFEEGATYVFTYESNGVLRAMIDDGVGLEWVEVDSNHPDTIPESAQWISTGVSTDGTNAYMQNKATGYYLSYNGSHITLSAGQSSKTYFLYEHFYHLNDIYNQYLIYLDGGLGYTTNEWDSALSVSLYKYTQVDTTCGDILYSITNTPYDESTSIGVTKRWVGNDGKYPDSIEVILLQNDIPYGVPVVLNASNSWAYTWENLPLKLGDKEFTYSIKEMLVEDYTSSIESITNEDGTLQFMLTNTWSPEYVSLELYKIDSINHDSFLNGAQFSLYRMVDEGETDAVQIPNTTAWGILENEDISTDESGHFRMEELWVGKTYYLVETVAPNGYGLLENPIVFMVEEDERGQPVLTILSGQNWIADSGTNESDELFMEICNEKVYILPETGGNGTQMYIIGGVLLIVAATGFLLYKKRKHRKEVFTSS